MATKKTREYAKALSQQQAVEGLNWATPRGKAVALEIRAYKARVEAYQSKRGLNWASWRGNAESIFNAVAFDWDTVDDNDGGELFDAIANKVEHEYRAVKLAA